MTKKMMQMSGGINCQYEVHEMFLDTWNSHQCFDEFDPI